MKNIVDYLMESSSNETANLKKFIEKFKQLSGLSCSFVNLEHDIDFSFAEYSIDDPKFNGLNASIVVYFEDPNDIHQFEFGCDSTPLALSDPKRKTWTWGDDEMDQTISINDPNIKDILSPASLNNLLKVMEEG